jgi:hypothetical protein
MDALSDVLRVIRLKGGVFLHAEFTAPWCIVSQLTGEDFGRRLQGAEHLVLYHYVVEGHLRAQIPNREPVAIEAGEVLILPYNDRHLLGSHLELPPVPAKQVVRVPPDGGLAVIRHGGGGEKTRVVCGYLGCDRTHGNPLTSALPPIVRFDARKGSVAALMKSSLEFAADEIAARRAGSEAVLAKLSELLFVEALRRYVEGLPDEQTGWLAGLKDPFVSRTLSLLHGRVAQQWTVDDLGRYWPFALGARRSFHAADWRAADALPGALAAPAGSSSPAQRRHAACAHCRASGLRVGCCLQPGVQAQLRSPASHLAQERVRNKCGVTVSAQFTSSVQADPTETWAVQNFRAEDRAHRLGGDAPA